MPQSTKKTPFYYQPLQAMERDFRDHGLVPDAPPPLPKPHRTVTKAKIL